MFGGQRPRPGGPVPGLPLFTAVPEVATLEVGDGAGTTVRVTELTRLDEIVLHLADSSPQTWAGYRFTAKDAAGGVVASAII